MRTRYCVILTSYSRKRTGSRIAKTLLGEKLAACVQSLPVTSLYTWKGRAVREKEHLMLIKAKAADYARIEAAIRGVHDYEVPEILSLPVERGSAPYLDWIRESTR